MVHVILFKKLGSKMFLLKKGRVFQKSIIPNKYNQLPILKKSINDLKYSCKSKLIYYENP